MGAARRRQRHPARDRARRRGRRADPPAEIPIERTRAGRALARRRGRRGVGDREPDLARADGRDRRPAGAVASRRRTRRARVRIPRRGHTTVTTTIRPTRRGRFDIHDLTVRAEGPLGLAARQQTRNLPSRAARPPAVQEPRRSRAAHQPRPHPRSRPALGTGSRRRHRVRSAARVRARRRVPPHRLGGHRAHRQGHRPHLPRRAQPDRAAAARQRARHGRPGRRGAAARARDGRGDDAHRRHAPGWATARGCSRSAEPVRAVVPPSGGGTQLGRITEAMYDLDAQLAESDYRAAFTEAMARFRRRALVVLLTELTEPVIEETLLPALPVMVRHHLVSSPASAIPTSSAGRARQPDRRDRGLPQGRRGRERSTIGGGRSPGCRAWARRSSTRRPAGSLPQLADAYLKVKATGRL